MKIDLNYKFLDLEGKVVKDRVPLLDENENQVFNDYGAPQFKIRGDFTLRRMIQETLFNPPLNREPRTGQFVQIPDKKKQECFVLLTKIINHKEPLIDLESEEQTLLKEMITKKYNSPWTIGQAKKAIDPTTADKD